MAEAARQIDEFEIQVAEAIALCDGDPVAALRAALVYNDFLERKLEQFRGMISAGYTRSKITPPQKASAALDKWREISARTDVEKNNSSDASG